MKPSCDITSSIVLDYDLFWNHLFINELIFAHSNNVVEGVCYQTGHCSHLNIKYRHVIPPKNRSRQRAFFLGIPFKFNICQCSCGGTVCRKDMHCRMHLKVSQSGENWPYNDVLSVMNVRDWMLTHSLKIKLAVLAAFLPGPRTRSLLFSLSQRRTPQ